MSLERAQHVDDVSPNHAADPFAGHRWGGDHAAGLPVVRRASNSTGLSMARTSQLTTAYQLSPESKSRQ